jgi:hypothetical protein
MDHSQITTKIWKDTHRKLRLLAARTEESIVALIDRLVIEETERVRNQVAREMTYRGTAAKKKFIEARENGEGGER